MLNQSVKILKTKLKLNVYNQAKIHYRIIISGFPMVINIMNTSVYPIHT